MGDYSLHDSIIAAVRCAAFVTVAVAVSGCATHHATQPFTPAAPFSKAIEGPSDSVCWSVKRALLSQGYILDRSSEPGVLTGTRDYQPNEKLNVSVRLQTTCADNHNGTSIVFAAAEREESQLQRMRQTTSAGIGPATITLPSGSARVLGVVRRETIQDPSFYNSFFALVQGYVAQEGGSRPERHAELRKPEPPPAEPSGSGSGRSDDRPPPQNSQDR